MKSVNIEIRDKIWVDFMPDYPTRPRSSGAIQRDLWNRALLEIGSTKLALRTRSAIIGNLKRAVIQ
jgi:hypothetical protein